MPSGLVALLDDIAMLAKLAAASVDDVGAAAGRAGAKAAGVVIDDTAVTPRYVVGLPPERELPIIAKIARGSLFNKLVLLLPAALLLSAFAPWAVTPILMLGGAFLAFEGTEKIVEKLFHTAGDDAGVETISDPAELEKRQVSGAVRTDFILSAEIMAIALGQIPEQGIVMQAVVLALIGVALTAGVYGVVAVIVKMDDVGAYLSRREGTMPRAIGRGLLWAMPRLLSFLSVAGVAAMLWVGGGIIVHGLHEFHLTPVPEWIAHGARGAATAMPAIGPAVAWLVEALASALVGLVVGAVIVGALHLVPRKAAH